MYVSPTLEINRRYAPLLNRALMACENSPVTPKRRQLVVAEWVKAWQPGGIIAVLNSRLLVSDMADKAASGTHGPIKAFSLSPLGALHEHPAMAFQILCPIEATVRRPRHRQPSASVMKKVHRIVLHFGTKTCSVSVGDFPGRNR
jgi:hypothetical protein